MFRGEVSRAETEVAEGVIAMSNSRDEDDRGTDAGPDKSYAVGNKKPPIKVTNDKLFAASLVKDGITKGPQSKLQLANRVERAEARVAAEAEAASRKKAAAEKNPPEVEWTEAQERIYQEICIATGAEPKI
jgi:hypothetical protein